MNRLLTTIGPSTLPSPAVERGREPVRRVDGRSGLGASATHHPRAATPPAAGASSSPASGRHDPVGSNAQVTPTPSFAGSNAELITAARQRDMRAWRAIYDKLYPKIYRRVRFLTGDPELALELTQESFARALEDIGRFQGRASFDAWLAGIALNLVRNHWRRRKNTDVAHDRLTRIEALREAPVGPERNAVDKARLEAIYAALTTLPDTLREAFILRELEGLSPEEGAQVTGLSKGSFNVRVTRARQRIRVLLGRAGWLDSARESGR